MFKKTQNAASSTQFSALVKVLIIAGFVLSTFCLTAAGSGISKTVTYSAGFTNNVFPIPSGISLTIGVSSSASGTITITGPGGFSAVRSLSSLGSSSFPVTLGAAGIYTVNESYSLTVTGSNALLGSLPSVSSSASATPWTFITSTTGATASFQVSSSFGSLTVTSTSANISASASDSAITITTTALINIGDSVSATAQGTWTVSTTMSVTEAPPSGTIEVTTNLAESTFNITGTDNYSGSGTSWTKIGAPVGNYTITYGDVDGYFTPESQATTLGEDETINFSGTYVEIPSGTINVTTNLAAATFSITGTANYNGSGTAWTKLKAPLGDYTITYGFVDGYFTPESQVATLGEGGVIDFSGTYVERPSGTINVTTNLVAATYSITGAAVYNGSGTSWTKLKASIGDYTIAYGFVDGYFTPESQIATLGEGGVIDFSGTYVSRPTGTINVTTNLDAATFNITGPSSYSGSSKSWTKSNASLGDYVITYNVVAGYATPSSRAATLEEDGVISFDGVYVKIPTGTISVTTNMDSATFSVTGPADYNGNGKKWTQAGAPLGEYNITYGDVPGYITPESQAATLAVDGETINFTGTYRSTGTIEVNTNLAAATFELSGPASYSGSGISWTQTGAVVGRYEITYGDVPGYGTPPPETRTLVNNGKITFTGDYVPLTGTINVTTNLDSATFNITGAADYSGIGTIWTEANTPTGDYTITYGDVAGYITPPSQTATLNADEAIDFDGEYIEIPTGTIEVTANLDSTTFNITGPADYSGVGMSWIQPGAPEGDYTIAYGDVPDYGTPAPETLTLVKDGVITFVGEYIPISIKIDTVDIAGSPAGLGDTIIVIMTGDPGHEAAFSIGDLVINAPMPEEIAIESGPVLGTPGLYRGEYVVQEGDNIEDAVVSVKLTSVTGATAINDDGRATIDTTPPAIDDVVVSGSPARSIGDIIMVTMKGESGAIATLSIAGVTRTTMVESVEQPGTYEATYTAVAGVNVSGAAVVVSLTDAVGNTSVDESQTVSICTLPWDINRDGIVDALDIQIVSSNIGKAATPELDLNGDGVIDTLDVLIVAIHFGETCGAEDGILAAAPSDSHTVPDHLFQNYPNPSNPGTWIPFMLAEGNETVVSIYSPSGQLVRRLDLGYKDPGVYVSREQGAYWDGSNEYGEKVASGVYFYHIKAGNFSAVRKMLIAR